MPLMVGMEGLTMGTHCISMKVKQVNTYEVNRGEIYNVCIKEK